VPVHALQESNCEEAAHEQAGGHSISTCKDCCPAADAGKSQICLSAVKTALLCPNCPVLQTNLFCCEFRLAACGTDTPDCKKTATLKGTQQFSKIHEVEVLKPFSKFAGLFRRELTSVQERLRLSGQDLQLDPPALHPLLCLGASDKPASTPACSPQTYFPRPTVVLPMMRRTVLKRQR